MDWGEFLNNAAQGEVAKYLSPKPAAPVAAAAGSAGVTPYMEGKPAAGIPAADSKIFGLPKMVVFGGAAVLAIGVFMMMRK